MQSNFTLQNHFTDYVFNPFASDEEIMRIAEESAALKQVASSKAVKALQRYSSALESTQLKKLKFCYTLN
jgi:hypothetical protein